MKFGDLIRILRKTNFFGCTQAEIGITLLRLIGLDEGVDNVTVAQWIQRGVPAGNRTYFPDGKIEGGRIVNFVEYLSSILADEKWRALQQMFKKECGHCIIDCSTDTPEIFYYSLLKQLILGFNIQVPAFLNAPYLSYEDGWEDSALLNNQLSRIKLHNIFTNDPRSPFVNVVEQETQLLEILRKTYNRKQI